MNSLYMDLMNMNAGQRKPQPAASVKALHAKLGFSEATQQLPNFITQFRTWRKTCRTSKGTDVKDLREWSSKATQRGLFDLAHQFLDEFGYRYWPPSQNCDGDGLRYPANKPQ